MKRFATALFLSVLFIIPSGIAFADDLPPRITLVDVFRTLQSDPTIPPEWSGIWSIIDTTYTCMDVFQSADASLDTLCTGMSVGVDEEPAPGIMIDCTGSVDATSADFVCTATFNVAPDCDATFTATTMATLSGDSYTSTTTVEIMYDGTGFGCDLIPDTCTKIVTHGTRVSAEPSAYCATPTEPVSWGKIKVRYR